MKIAILSLVLHENYGGILQSYALQTVLERMGHTVEVLNRPPTYPSTKWKEIPKRIVKKLLGRDVVIFKESRYKREAATINKAVWNFRKKYIHERIINDFTEIKESDYDCIVVGSDQVWRPKYFKSQWGCGIENAYLSFTKGWNIKRIVYAASFGVDEWEYTEEETRVCAEYAKMFDLITVREDSGVNLVKKYFRIEATQVLDPTMLLDKVDYIKLIEESKTPKCGGSLLAYILNGSRDKVDFINNIAEEHNLKPFSVNNSFSKKTAPTEKRVLPSIVQWLRGFYDAEFVITDSFHACVFSIIFGKPFVALGNQDRGQSRFESLLQNFSISDRLLQDCKYNNIDLSSLMTSYNCDIISPRFSSMNVMETQLIYNKK